MAALEREHNYRVKSLPRGQHAQDKIGDALKVVLVDCCFFIMALAIYLYSRFRVLIT